MARARRTDAVRITDAPEPLSADISARQRRYLIAMLARTVFFILAGITGIMGILWLALIFVLAAIVLPYVAVVMANGATPTSVEASPFGMIQHDRRELGSRPDQGGNRP